MKDKDRAKLIVAVSKALDLNEKIGNYTAIRNEGVNKLIQLISGIKEIK